MYLQASISSRPLTAQKSGIHHHISRTTGSVAHIDNTTAFPNAAAADSEIHMAKNSVAHRSSLIAENDGDTKCCGETQQLVQQVANRSPSTVQWHPHRGQVCFGGLKRLQQDVRHELASNAAFPQLQISQNMRTPQDMPCPEQRPGIKTHVQISQLGKAQRAGALAGACLRW